MLIKHDKQRTIKLLTYITKATKADMAAFKAKLIPNEMSLYSYEDCLNSVYLALVDLNKGFIYDQFGTIQGDNKPVAWVKGEGFIPDIINNTILAVDLSAENKYKIIIKYLRRLSKIQKDYESNL